MPWLHGWRPKESSSNTGAGKWRPDNIQGSRAGKVVPQAWLSLWLLLQTMTTENKKRK